jgi:hypothetical protein
VAQTDRRDDHSLADAREAGTLTLAARRLGCGETSLLHRTD